MLENYSIMKITQYFNYDLMIMEAGRYCGPEGCVWTGFEERTEETDA